jgi:hypothetical protein
MRADGRTDMTKLIVAFGSFTNWPEKEETSGRCKMHEEDKKCGVYKFVVR